MKKKAGGGGVNTPVSAIVAAEEITKTVVTTTDIIRFIEAEIAAFSTVIEKHAKDPEAVKIRINWEEDPYNEAAKALELDYVIRHGAIQVGRASKNRSNNEFEIIKVGLGILRSIDDVIVRVSDNDGYIDFKPDRDRRGILIDETGHTFISNIGAHLKERLTIALVRAQYSAPA